MTIKERLEKIAAGNSSDEADDQATAYVARRLGYPRAVATCGIIYLDGQGTIENPPMPIQSFARTVIKALGEKRG